MAMAYAALAESVRQQIDGLQAMHSWQASCHNSGNRFATARQDLSCRRRERCTYHRKIECGPAEAAPCPSVHRATGWL